MFGKVGKILKSFVFLGDRPYGSCSFWICRIDVAFASVLSSSAFSNSWRLRPARYVVECTGTVSVFKSLVQCFEILIYPEWQFPMNLNFESIWEWFPECLVFYWCCNNFCMFSVGENISFGGCVHFVQPAIPCRTKTYSGMLRLCPSSDPFHCHWQFSCRFRQN